MHLSKKNLVLGLLAATTLIACKPRQNSELSSTDGTTESGATSSIAAPFTRAIGSVGEPMRDAYRQEIETEVNQKRAAAGKPTVQMKLTSYLDPEKDHQYLIVREPLLRLLAEHRDRMQAAKDQGQLQSGQFMISTTTVRVTDDTSGSAFLETTIPGHFQSNRIFFDGINIETNNVNCSMRNARGSNLQAVADAVRGKGDMVVPIGTNDRLGLVATVVYFSADAQLSLRCLSKGTGTAEQIMSELSPYLLLIEPVRRTR